MAGPNGDLDGFVRLRPHLGVVTHGPDDVEIRQGVWSPTSFAFSDTSKKGKLAQVVSALDGSRPLGDVASENGVSREDLERLIDRLVELNLVETAPTSAIDYYTSVATAWRVAPTEHQRIVLVADQQLGDAIDGVLRGGVELPVERMADDDPVARAAADVDSSWLDDGLSAERTLAPFEAYRDAIVVVAGAQPNPVVTSVLNRGFVRHGVTWLFAAVDGPFVFVGPTFAPRHAGCYACLETRIYCNVRDGANYQRYKEALARDDVRQASRPLVGVQSALLAAYVGLEVTNLALTGWTFTMGRVIAIHLPTMEISMPEVLPVPGCPACGSVVERDQPVLYFDTPLEPADAI
jgi:bacteriocin biosynthesis cyclodehydratase domain-containing protein